MKKIRTGAIISALLLLSLTSAALAKDIKGTVTDAATREPLAGVKVQAYGDNRYTAMTDDKGQYTITVPDAVSSLYFTVEDATPLQLAIGTDTNHVDAHMYNATFTTTYTATTTGNRRSQASNFNNHSEPSIDPFITNQLAAEVHTISRGGTDGIGNTMFIAGLNSLNANAQPLIIIDGVIIDMQYNRTMLHDGYYNNILANINVNDIDKVEVLKNGTAIYGAKAANGVILITTKRSKSLTTNIDVTIGGKFQLMPRTASMMNATDYRTYATELLATEVTNMSAMKFLNPDNNYYYYPQYHNNTDWKKQVYRNTYSQNYGITVQGGDNVAQYNLSVGYNLSNSTLKEHNFSRFDMRLNTDIEVIEHLNTRFDASFSDVKRNLRDIGMPEDVESTTITAPNVLALIKAPFLSPYAFATDGSLSTYLAEADDYLEGTIITSDRSLANPVSILNNGDGENRNTFGNRLVMFTITPRYQINNHLALSEQFNFSLVNTNENYYLPITGVPSFRVPGLTNRVYVNNIVQSISSRQNAIQSDTRIDWNNHYNAHAIKLFGGMRYIKNTYKYTLQKGYNTPNDKTPNMSTSLQYKSTQGADDKYTDITWYANADYNYAERYYLSAALSAQTSSRFGADASALKAFGTVWGLFPSIQASYVISNEKWFANLLNHISYLRLNLGYDITGNDDIDYTASRTYFIARNMLNGTIDGKLIGNVGNNTLKWETTRRLTAGIEANLLNNRLHLAFNYFLSHTNNLLTKSSMTWISGLDENWCNNGKLRNSGFDATLSGKAINNKNLHWELGASAGHYKNTVTALGTDKIETNIYGATILTAIDNPVGMFYGHRTAGVFATTEQATASGLYQLDESGNKVYFQAGDMIFLDTNNDHCINDDDRTIIGNPNPDLYGNIFSHLNYKNWNLDITLTYCLGNDIYNYERSILESGKYFYNQTTALNARWTTEGQHTTIPRASYQDSHGNSRFSDRWIEDGSYLRLNNVTLSYRLPISTAYIQGITLYGAAQNIFTITRYLGSNPDCSLSGNVLSQGIDRGLLGTGRSFSIGAKINL